ncbi:6137_t:CDS:10, partial [Scutellospora calospora]
RDELIKKFGKCPTCEGLPKEDQKKPIYKCPDCGIPTHCSEEHYKQNLIEHKLHTCEMLKEFNEDTHDLMSGRKMPELEFPSSQSLDEEVNLLNWDTFLYTRGFPSIDHARSLRHVSKLLTYPITIGSVLHQNGPYTLRNRLTNEGLKSLIALRTTLHPKQTSVDIKTLQPAETVRIFIIGARAEAQLPLHLYTQLSYLFPTIALHIHFIGPESILPGNESHTTHFNHYLSFTWKNSFYHDYHDSISPFDPYCDIFFLFHPGIYQNNGKELWEKTIKKLLKTKCAILITGFNENDMKNEIQIIEEDDTFEFDWILEPGENEFKSLRRDIDIKDVRIGVYPNWGIFGIRGKRYDIRQYEEDDGRLTLPIIAKLAKFTLTKTRECLFILIQHNLVYWAESREGQRIGIYYSIEKDEILTRLNFGIYIKNANEWIESKHASELVKYILLNGKVTFAGLVEEMKINKKSNKKYYVLPVNFADSKSARDKATEAEQRELAKVTNFIPTKKQMAEAKAKLAANLDTDDVATGSKRKLNMDNFDRPAKQLKGEITIDDNQYYRVNYEKFNVKARNKRFSKFVRNLINHSAGMIMKYILDIADCDKASDIESCSISLQKIIKNIPESKDEIFAQQMKTERGKTVNRESLIKQYLDCLIEDDANILCKKDENMGGMYFVKYNALCESLKQQ